MSQFFWPVLLLFATFALIGLELIIPSGGILGIFATIAYVASIVSAFMSFGLEWGTLYLIASMLVAIVFGSLFIRIWPKTPIGRRIFGAPPSESDVIPERHRELDSLVGIRGVAISTMIPSGAIRVNGRVMDAVSEGVVIEADSRVEVVRVKGNHIVVRPVDASEPPRSAQEIQAALDKPVEMIVPDPFDDES